MLTTLTTFRALDSLRVGEEMPVGWTQYEEATVAAHAEHSAERNGEASRA